ncbi:MAG TPA: sulfite exporter TauE/SafE family protein [Desulfomonilaceae bacterium]|nr:sulfite exporter TauE/SafE family protein [Desulfomonilaceae bacterium]
MQAFLLGLSNGAVCIAYCAPVLVPYLFGEGRAVLQNFSVVVQFLSGRLLGYLLFGMLAWALGQTILLASPWRDLTIGSANMILSVFLVLYGFFRVGAVCPAERAGRWITKINTWWPFMLPATMGLFTGLNFCPPFLLAFTNAAGEASLFQTLAFFFLFFLGTSVFFIPFPLIGGLRRVTVFGVVGKLAAGVIGIYYFYTGLMLFINGMHSV